MESTSSPSGSLQESSRIRRSITKKFVRPHDGPWKVTGGITPPVYKVTSEQGEVTNVYNETALNPYGQTYGVKKKQVSLQSQRRDRSRKKIICIIFEQIFITKCSNKLDINTKKHEILVNWLKLLFYCKIIILVQN